MTSRKPRHYFQAHEITVVTRFLLQRILQNPEATGRIVEWDLELSSFGLKFESTSTIQSRALAKYIIEWKPTPDEEVPETVILGKEAPQEWIMYFDGAFSLQGAGPDMLLIAPTGTTREKPSSSAGFGPISSARAGATNKALQLTYSSSAGKNPRYY